MAPTLTAGLTRSLTTLFGELVHGAHGPACYMLNKGDAGLLASLDRLPAEAASARHAGGSSIAAHVEHLRYGLSLMNRWAAGENPWADASWAEAWDMNGVTEREWAERRDALRAEAEQWQATLGEPREVGDIELSGMIGSIAHLAYHLGAIRQMDRAMRGPAAND